MKINVESWLGKVKDWKQCEKCKKFWTPMSLKNDICPECRGEVKRIYAPIVEELVQFFEENQHDNIKLKEEIKNRIQSGEFDDEKKLLRCKECSKYVLDLFFTNFGVFCAECYEKFKYMNKKENKEDRF